MVNPRGSEKGEKGAGQRFDRAALWPSHGKCRLCGTEEPLRRSHLIPKFVGDWLRKTGATPRLRAKDAPNKLVEDLEWRHMLCERCEARFSSFETPTSRRVFLPLHADDVSRFRYGPYFTKFAVSVVWRALVVRQAEGLGKLAHIPEQVEAAERAWREFLLGQRSTPAPHDVHALPLDRPANSDLSDFSPHLSRFMLRGVTSATQSHQECGYVVVKMARLMVVGTIAAGGERRYWKGTKLHADGGSWGTDSYHVPGWVRHFLVAGAQAQQDMVDGLSVKQKRLTNEALLKAIDRDPHAVARSGSVKAFKADLALFGRAAFQKPSSSDNEEK